MASRRRPILIAFALCLGLGVAIAIIEIAFRVTPRLIPAWYRQTLPAGGTELVTPGLLERTPICGVPIPYGFDHQRVMTGKVPRDLEHMGLVAPPDNPDVIRYPGLRYRFDRFGFLNPSEMNEVDLLLVGDSFTVAAGMLEPPGLQARLTQATGLEVFNLAVPSIGPVREKWLLEEVGLGLDPELVVWFFFGGNDLDDAARVERHRRDGIESYADLARGRETPPLLSGGLVLASIRSVFRREVERNPLPGHRFVTREGKTPVWFYPAHLRRLTRSMKDITDSVGWSATEDVLLSVSETLARRRIQFLVVYVPSKAQVYLPLVERDAELTHDMASRGRSLPTGPEAFLRSAIAHRGNLEGILGEFCRDHEIPYRSLTPKLDRLAGDGVLGYLSADTHWNEIGQAAALPELLAWIDHHAGDVLPRQRSGD